MIHKILLGIFSGLPIVFSVLVIIVAIYHDGYFVETTVSYTETVIFPPGEQEMTVTFPLPEGHIITIQNNETTYSSTPPPFEVETYLDWTEKYLTSRFVKVTMDTVFDPYFNTKLVMLNLQDDLVYVGLIITLSGTIFDNISRHRQKRTIIQVYRIDKISIIIKKYVIQFKHQDNK